jgi:hypothetical protein
MSFLKPTKAETATPHDALVDGYLSYAIAVNMKVGGTLGNEDSIVVESSAPAVSKRAPAVPFGLLALDRHTHLNVLAYLQPNWVRGGGLGEKEREREKKSAKHWSSSLKTQQNPQPATPFVPPFAVGENFRVDSERGEMF